MMKRLRDPLLVLLGALLAIAAPAVASYTGLLPNNTVLGNIAGSQKPAVPLTAAQITALINACNATTKGEVPTPPNNTTTFLRGDCSFAAVSGGGGGSFAIGPGSSTAGDLADFSGTDGLTLEDSAIPKAQVMRLDAAQASTAAHRSAVQTVAISTATFTPNFDTGQDFSITLVHASCPCTLANPSTTPVTGQHGVIKIKQSSTGSDTITTWGSDYIFAGGTSSIALSSGANALDYFAYYVDDSTHIVLSSGVLNATH